MLVLVVLASLVILFIGAAFSVDIARTFLANEQMHMATDAGCEGRGSVVCASGYVRDTAINTAISHLAANTVCGVPLSHHFSNVDPWQGDLLVWNLGV